MKLAILGSGKIAPTALEAMREVPGIERRAIYARPHSRAKGEALAAEYGVAEVYTDYDELLRRADIDTVYMALINSAHFEYAKKALLSGKHVIMEKPFCTNARDSEQLAALARERGLYMFEAVVNRNCPVMDEMRRLLPLIGQVRMVQANYSQYSSRYDRYRRREVTPQLDPQACGGSLYDINIYNLNMAIALFGAPQSVDYYANIGFNGVDISGTVMMRYPGFVAALSGAKDSDSPCHFTVQGEDGYITMPGKPSEAASLVLQTKNERREFTPPPVKNRMVPEFRIFERALRERDSAFMNRELDISLDVMRAAEQARRSAGIVFPE